jgi:hypothetical protein
MKGKELLMLLLILGVGTWAITHWLGGGSGVPDLLSPIASRLGGATPAKPAEKPAEKEAKAVTKKRRGGQGSSPAATDTAFPDEPSTITVLVPSSHYPGADDLKLGSTGTEIRSEFGEPSARVSGVRDGYLLERYYYMNNERTRVTIATLKNGVLIGAQTQVR